MSAHDDELALGHLVDGVADTLASLPRILDAPVGHVVGAETGGDVDQDGSGLDLLGKRQGRTEALGEDRRVEAEAGVVDAPDRLREARQIDTTGPNTSSRSTRADGSTLVSTVAGIRAVAGSDPAST
jgi:hypothetical protein